MDFDQLFPGRFLKAGLFQGRDVTLTIRSVKVEKLPKDGGGEETKGIVAFTETERELVLNKTNGLCILAMFGRETNNWVGKRVTLYPTEFEGDLCIRVRGSPDLAGDVTFELKLARKKAKRTVMKKTAGGHSKAAAEPARASPPKAHEPTAAPPSPPVPPSAPRPVEPVEKTKAEPATQAVSDAAPTEAALAGLPF